MPELAVATPPVAAAASDSLAAIRELQARIRGMQSSKRDSGVLATHPALASVLPGGALRTGAVYCVSGSTTLLMALLAGPSAAGAWCGVVGLPDFGAEAASRFSIDLERVAFVPHPGEHWFTVTAALADVLTVVVTKPLDTVSPARNERLVARLRQHGATLLVAGSWPQSEATLRVTESRWSGIGSGRGNLTGREVTVSATSAAYGGRARSARLWLPDAVEAFRSIGDAELAERPVLAETPVFAETPVLAELPVLEEATG